MHKASGKAWALQVEGTGGDTIHSITYRREGFVQVPGRPAAITTSPHAACVESRRAKMFLRATSNLQKIHLCLGSHAVGYRLLGYNMKNVLHNKTKKKKKESILYLRGTYYIDFIEIHHDYILLTFWN